MNGANPTLMKRFSMKILDLNVNDFGGKKYHLEEYKKYGLRQWDAIDKTDVIDGILSLIDGFNPDIVIFQEYDINSSDAKLFEKDMLKRGYLLKSEKVRYVRPSMTVFFIKTSIEALYVPTGHELNGRAYAVKIGDVTVYGTHVPPKGKNRIIQFWKEMIDFADSIASGKIIFIGDFNTINVYNMMELESFLHKTNAIDAWKAKGNTEQISIMGDYVICSPDINLETAKISSCDTAFSDHPVIYLSI